MLLRSPVESHYRASSHYVPYIWLIFVIDLIINDVNVYSATWATDGALKELSHPLIHKVSTETIIHIATTTMIQGISPTGLFRQPPPDFGLRVDV